MSIEERAEATAAMQARDVNIGHKHNLNIWDHDQEAAFKASFELARRVADTMAAKGQVQGMLPSTLAPEGGHKQRKDIRAGIGRMPRPPT